MFPPMFKDDKLRFGLGMAAIGRPGYMNLGHAADMPSDRSVDAMQSHAFSVLDAAWQKGIRYFDVARSYGLGEQFLANWLDARRIEPDKVFIASKWGYTYTAQWRVQVDQHEVKDHSLSVLLRQWKESKAFLGSFLRLYQIHSATLESGVLDDMLILDQFAELKSKGLMIGLSVTGVHQAEIIRKAMEIERDGEHLFDAIQCTFNLYEPAARNALKEAHQKGLGVIIKEALANGRLSPRGDLPNWVTDIAANHHVSVDALAIAFVHCQPFVDVVLSGAANQAQLDSHLNSLQLHADLFKGPRWQELQIPSEEYWRQRSQLSWN